MNLSLRPSLFLLCAALSPVLLPAAEPAAAPTQETAKPAEAAAPAAPAKDTAKPASPAADTKPVELLKFEVLGVSRIHDIDVEIKKLTKLLTREKKKVKPTELDRTFNNPQVAKGAAIFGGNSADHLSAVAASRVSLMETELEVLEAMKRPATLESRNEMQKELEQLRETRRNLDDAARQR
ncbi:MAG: hypothetical protein JWQ83_1635 [Lacunisphaera sp.]|nr:hypothetical protein [Lacunisphaera sp.]